MSNEHEARGGEQTSAIQSARAAFLCSSLHGDMKSSPDYSSVDGETLPPVAPFLHPQFPVFLLQL